VQGRIHNSLHTIHWLSQVVATLDFQKEWIRVHTLIAKQLGKPLLFQEFGRAVINATDATIASDRNPFIQVGSLVNRRHACGITFVVHDIQIGEDSAITHSSVPWERLAPQGRTSCYMWAGTGLNSTGNVEIW
jgi:hypothetical protein